MIEQELSERGVFVYTTKGVSMRPLLRQNRDLIVVRARPEERLKKYDTALFKRDNGDYVLHRVVQVREHDYIICGDNLEQMEPVREDQILGVLQEIVRNGKTITVHDIPYNIYVHLWWDAYPVRFFLRKVRRLGGRVKRKLLNQ
ncbi:MAG: S24/S26 family peptidase [Oscillospiraceae bacterium]|nr:S24/S26 family peptidase [Oscillospiraceae bacterium]